MVQLKNVAMLEEFLCSLVSQERQECSFSVLVLTEQTSTSVAALFCVTSILQDLVWMRTTILLNHN